jgi:hypothetical protein
MTEQQCNEIKADFAQQSANVGAKYSLEAAQQVVSQISLLCAQANVVSLKLEADYQRQVLALILQSSAEATQVQIAATKEGSVQQLDLERINVDLEQEVALAALDKRAMSDLEYEMKVTPSGLMQWPSARP